MLLQKIKSHLDLHRDLKYTLPLEELHPQGSEANQVLGADALLKCFVNMYKANPKIKYDLLVWVIHGVVSNITEYHSWTLPQNAYIYVFGLIYTSRKGFELVSITLIGSVLYSYHRIEAGASQDIPSTDCIHEDMIYVILEYINIQTDGLIGINALSICIDATKVVQSVRLSDLHKVIVGDSHHNNFISGEEISKYYMQDRINLVRNKYKKWELSYEVKVVVVSL